jgi:hypothetical protein
MYVHIKPFDACVFVPVFMYVHACMVCVCVCSPPFPHGPHAGAAGGCRPPQCPGGTSTSLAAGGCRASQYPRPRPSTSPAPCPAGMPLSIQTARLRSSPRRPAGGQRESRSRAAVMAGAGRARVHALLQVQAAGRGAAGSTKALNSSSPLGPTPACRRAPKSMFNVTGFKSMSRSSK